MPDLHIYRMDLTKRNGIYKVYLLWLDGRSLYSAKTVAQTVTVG